MSDVIPPADDAPDDTLAGEYVLGVLDEAERRAVRLRSREDEGLASAILSWERRLAGLSLTVDPLAPPPALWERIADGIAPLADTPDPVPPRMVAPRARTRWGWPLATGVSLALAAGLAGIMLLRPPPGPDFASVRPNGLIRLASIGPLNTPSAAFVAEARPDGTVVLIPVSPGPVPAGRTLELWQLQPGAAKPASLGVLPETGKVLRLGDLPPTGTQLLISQEPTGGSPTGQPTGPVLYGGMIQR